MNNRKIDDLIEDYMNIKISDKLEDRVNEAIKESKKLKKRGINMKKGFIGVAASVAVVIGMLNVSPAFADAVKEVPIVGNLVNLVVVKNYKVNDKNVEADINVSKIDGLKNKELQDNLNEEFMKQGKEAYENLIKEIPDIGEGKKYVGMDYKIKSETDSILSIEVSKSEIQASGYETRKHYVIDKEKQVVLTLPLIFKDKSYVDVISDNIKEQMRKQIKEAYENLIKEIPDIGEGKKYVGMDYKIKSETDSILSIEVSKSEIQASGYETRKHYVIDKEKQVVLTLPLIFKDKSYVDVISDNIKEQMRKQMKEDEGKSYFIDSEKDFAEDDFKKIAENQDFYINSNNDLVICFDEYEVAPGYMGPVEFVIPKEIVDNLK